MPWNSLFPDGSRPVNVNLKPLQENTKYIETTMGKDPSLTVVSKLDHFWNNADALKDGHHRYLQSPAFTVGGQPKTPIYLESSIDGVLYLKNTMGFIQGFYKNKENDYQYIPGYKTGTVKVENTFNTLKSIPANSYGQIFMYLTTTTTPIKRFSVIGFFRSNDTHIDAYAEKYYSNSNSNDSALIFETGRENPSLNIRVKTSPGTPSDLIWNYKITFMAL